MAAVFEKEMEILISMCDREGCLSYPAAFSLFMDAASYHAEILGIGLKEMTERQLFWLTAKTRIEFIKRPRYKDKVVLRTWPEVPDRLRCNRSYEILKDGEVILRGKTEWVILNTATNRIETPEKAYPEWLEFKEGSASPEPFSRISDKLSAEDYFTYRVSSSDIDVGGHMNNAAYLRAMFGSFSGEEISGRKIREVEAIFRSSCFEGDCLGFQKEETENGLVFRMHLEDKTIFQALIK